MIKFSQQDGIEIDYDPIRSGNILNNYGDISLIKEILGYRAEYDALNGFKQYLDYCRIFFFQIHEFN